MNYDLYSTESKAVFLEIKKKFYWINKPGRSESTAYDYVDRDKFGDARLVGNLRAQMLDKMDDFDSAWKSPQFVMDYDDDDEEGWL